MKRLLIALILVVTVSGLNCKKSPSMTESSVDDLTIDVQILTQDLINPWEILWGPDNMIWMTERAGRISQIDPNNGNRTSLYTVPDVKSLGEGGLLGMVLHPSFNTNPHVFIAYNYDKSGVYTAKIVRYTYSAAGLSSPVTILDNIPASSIHNGCRLIISADLKLFISTGDASNSQSAQNINSLSGKILRLNLDGTIPADNPISNNPLWTFGHRNPQGLVFVNSKLFSSEHGPDRDDEVNILQKSRNFGWPAVNGFCNEASEQSFCSSNNVVEPLKSWTPTIAVSGMDYYNKDAVPQWQNSLILTSLKDQTLYQLRLNSTMERIDETKEIFRGQYGRLRDVCISPDGKIYVATSNGSNDKVIVLKKK